MSISSVRSMGNRVQCPERQARGFSLMQLMIVIAIVGILGSIGVPGYHSYIERSRDARAVGDLGKIELAIKQFVIEHSGELPAGLADVGHDGDEDPWGSAYRFVNFADGGAPRTGSTGAAANSDYDLYSTGRDGETSIALTDDPSRDDIIRAGNGAYLGPVREFSQAQ